MFRACGGFADRSLPLKLWPGYLLPFTKQDIAFLTLLFPCPSSARPISFFFLDTYLSFFCKSEKV